MPCDGQAGARAVGVELGAVRKEPRPCPPGTHLCGAGRASCRRPHSSFRAPVLPLRAQRTIASPRGGRPQDTGLRRGCPEDKKAGPQAPAEQGCPDLISPSHGQHRPRGWSWVL